MTSGRLNFVCTSRLIKDSVWTGTHIVRTVAAFFPYLCFRMKSFSLSNSQRRPAVLLRCLSGCNLEQFEGSRRKVLVVRTDDALTTELPDRISRRLDGCKGSDYFYLESVQNLLETKL